MFIKIYLNYGYTMPRFYYNFNNRIHHILNHRQAQDLIT